MSEPAQATARARIAAEPFVLQLVDQHDPVGEHHRDHVLPRRPRSGRVADRPARVRADHRPCGAPQHDPADQRRDRGGARDRDGRDGDRVRAHERDPVVQGQVEQPPPLHQRGRADEAEEDGHAGHPGACGDQEHGGERGDEAARARAVRPVSPVVRPRWVRAKTPAGHQAGEREGPTRTSEAASSWPRGPRYSRPRTATTARSSAVRAAPTRSRNGPKTAQGVVAPGPATSAQVSRRRAGPCGRAWTGSPGRAACPRRPGSRSRCRRRAARRRRHPGRPPGRRPAATRRGAS